MSRSLTSVGAGEIAQRLLDELLRDRAGLIALAQDLSAPRAGRAWIRVADTADADAWLIAWNRHSHVGTHDHGGSHGAVHVLRGALVETYQESDDLRPAHVRQLSSGATVSVPPDRVHDVAQAGLRRALSLHVYSPRLTSMTFYPAGNEAVPG